MNRRDTSQANGTNKAARNAKIIAAFMTVFMVVVTVYFLAQGEEIDIALRASLVTMTSISVVATWLSYKGHIRVSMLMLIAPFLLLIALNQFTAAGDGLVYGLLAATVTAGIAVPTLSGKWLNRVMVAGVVAGVLIVFLDVFGPVDRPNHPNTTIDYIIMIGLAGVLVYFLARQLHVATLRPKLMAAFVFIALIGTAVTYLSTQFATVSLTEDALPSQQLFGQIALEAKVMQAEVLEFISVGDEDSVEELNQSVVELTTLSSQIVELADDPEEISDFTTLAENANEAARLAQELVQSHAQTLDALETMEASEELLLELIAQAQVIISDEIVRNIADENAEELAEDAIPSQAFLAEFNSNTQLLLTETLEYVTKGDQEAIDDFEEAEERLEVAQANLEVLLELDEPGEADLGAQLSSTKDTIETTGRTIIASHTNTLDLLEQLESLEDELGDNLNSVEQLIIQDVKQGETAANNLTIISTVFALTISGVLGIFVSNTVVRPVSQLVSAAQKLGAGDLAAQAQVKSHDEIGTLSTTFNEMAGQLRQTLGQLERRARQMETSAEVSRRLSTILDEQELARTVVEQVKRAFNYYHAHIYLLDKTGDRLVMVGGTGEAGTAMLTQDHSIPIGQGLAGRAVATRETILVPDVSQEEGWSPNPLMPDTKAETAVPIRLGDQVLGVLAVQQDSIDGLSQIDVELLSSVANQVAIGLQNATLFAQKEKALISVQEEQARVQTILDSITTPTLISGIADGLVLYVNEPLAEMIRVPQEALIGEKTPDFYVNPEDRDPFLAQLRENGFINNYELNLKRGDGDVFWSLVSGRIINYQGQPALMTSLVDINERKQMEAELQSAHLRTEEILESITFPLVISRVSDGVVAYVNEPLAEIIRVPGDELIGQITPDFYYDPADRQGYLAGLREQGRIDNYDVRLKRGDGDLFWALISGRIINFQGEPAIITSLIDINERREAQALVTRQAAELETVAEVGTVAATILDPNQLLQQVVDLTKERFQLYHAHLYLLDEGKAELTLTTGAGDIGRTMVAEGRQIALSQEQSLVARAARTHKGVIVNDVRAESGFLPHPLLPDTRAEMAVPLIVGKQVLGVLDVQVDQVDHFTVEGMNIFTTLASQIAVALQNARRHDEAQRALDELTRLQRIMAREGWEAFLLAQERPLSGFTFDGKSIKPITSNGDEVTTVVETDADETDTETAVSIPIAVRGEAIGQLGLRNPDGSPIPERKQALLQTVAQQVSEALERARLAEQTQLALTETGEQARRRSLLNEVSEELNQAKTLDDVYQITAERTALILPSDRVTLSILNDTGDQYTIVSLAGEGAKVPLGDSLPLAGTLSEKAIRSGTVLVTHDPQPRRGVASSMVAPLLTNEGPIGTLNVSSKAVNVYNEADRDVIFQIAAILASVIQSKRLFIKAQRRAEREAKINAISQKIQSAPTVESALQTAVTELGQALKLTEATVEITAVKQKNGHK
ncbi:GAF domain-containing protein [Candidatus Leptofilum sp.]|uniref:GAF domain-containing protein n=1 Tax=Candidatus Leptofilum sp. TaxID=3241576 RepID=UPI003B58FBF0